MKALTLLKPLIDSLPNYDNSYQSFYNIIGVHDKENYNSNVLAYFFNPEAGHGLERLWINALLECLIEKGVEIPNGFNMENEVFVSREESTSEQKRLDLVIRSGNSAIIIENKVKDKKLRNDLEHYWKSVKEKYKIGIVLSVEVKKIPSKVKDKFTLVQHQNLTQIVERNLVETKLEGEEKFRQTALLKDYFQHINKLYDQYKYKKAMQKQIGKYFTHQTEIKKVVDFYNNAQNDLIKTVNDLMVNHNFKKSGDFYLFQSNENIKFYIDKSHLLNGLLSITFELRGELNQVELGKKMVDKLSKEWHYDGQPELGTDHERYKKEAYYHLGWFWGKSFINPPKGKPILDHLSDIIETAYFKIPEGQTLNFVEFCMNELAELQKD
jgi:hypothetical protein